MSKQESLTHKWLRQNLQPYATPDVVFAHVDAVLSRHPAIRPKTDVYTYDDGRTQLLLCLHGLLPMTFRGASYHIPIAVWLPRQYPRFPPIPYVVPTADMLIRAGPEMDVSGRCFVQYIRNWERKSEGCSLAALLESMQEAFSREPPVYAKPKDAASTTAPTQPARPVSSTTPDYSHRPPPPLPGNRTDSPAPSSQITPAAVQPGGPPPLPAKPGTPAASNTSPSRTTSLPLPHALHNQSQSPTILSSPALATRPPPPLPPQEVAGRAHLQNLPVPPSYASHGHTSVDLAANTPLWPGGVPSSSTYQARSQSPYRAVGPSPSPPPAISPSTSGVGSPAGYGGFTYHAYPGHGHAQSPAPPPPFSAPQPTAGAMRGPPYAASPLSHSQTQALAPPPFPPTFSPAAPTSTPAPAPPSVPAPDLLDGEDSGTAAAAASLSASPPPPGAAHAPPRPPNPELLRLHEQVHAKISSELASLSQAMALDAERLRANQTDLLAGEPAIRDEMARLEAVRDVCRGVAARLEGVVAAGERNVAELRRKGDPEVDEMICSTTIVYNQLINLVAEDNAIEDTIYHLHRALNTGRVDLERFLRVTRVLAEEQFMKRALIEKIQSGIMPPAASSADWPAPQGWR